jgi:hypothetical protein
MTRIIEHIKKERKKEKIVKRKEKEWGKKDIEKRKTDIPGTTPSGF